MRTVRWALSALACIAAACGDEPTSAKLVDVRTSLAPATADWPERPAAFNVVNDRPFSSRAKTQRDTKGAEGWSTDERITRMRIVADATAPHSPSSVAEYRIIASGDGHASASYYYLPRNTVRALHFGMWVKLADGFQGRGNNDVVTLWLGDSPTFIVASRGTGSAALTPVVIHNASADSRNVLAANVAEHANVRIDRGRWQRWEFVVSSNTPGSRDGVLIWSIDGKRVLEYGDLGTIRAGESDTFSELHLAPGYTLSGTRLATWLRVDHATIATSGHRLSSLPTAPGTTPPPAPVPVASISIDPASATVLVGESIQLNATLRDANGGVLTGRTVTWTSTADAVASVSGSGLAHGLGVGTTSITATSEGQSATATLTVTQVAVASVGVSLASSALTVGQTTQASATARDASGNPLTGRPVVWSSSNPGVATVSPSGLVTAVAAGSTDIVATIEGNIGQAALAVAASPPPPPPTGDAMPGGTVIFSEGWESGSFAQWDDVANATQRIVTDPAQARTGSRVLEVTYPAGSEGGGYLNKFFMPGYDSVYVSYWIRLPDTWQGGTYLVGLVANRIDNQWSGFGRAGVCPDGTDFFNSFLYAEYSGNPGPTRFYTYYPGMPSAGGCWGHDGAGVASYYDPTALTRGQWQRVEFFVKANTVGQANGAQRFWINGTLRGEWRNMRQRTTTDLRLNALQMTFQHSRGVPQTQRAYVDDIQVKVFSSGTTTPPPPATVATVTVSPASASRTVGQTIQLTATARDASGAVLTNRPVTWSTSNAAVASVSASGLVTANAAGGATVTATIEGRSATATLTVTAPLPPPGGGGSFANEPAGMTLVSDYGFDALDAAGWTYMPQHASARIVQDAGDAVSPSNVLEFVYPAGFTSAGHAPASVRPTWPGRLGREVYWGFTWKASPGFENHMSGVNKLLYGWVNDEGLFGISWLWSEENTPGYRQQMGFFAGGVYYYVNQPACATMRLLPGAWHRIELHFRASSRPGVADGSVRLWFNGTLCADHPAISTLAGTISDSYLEPTWGGAGGPAMGTANYFRFGHVRLSTR